MGDAFDEDEGRLMIDDVVESSNLNVSGTSANSKKTNSSCAQDGVYNTDSKEEGEIDDEEDAGGSGNATIASSASASSQQNPNAWSAVQQAHGFETLLNGGNKMVYSVEQHSDRGRGTGHAQPNSYQLSGGSQIPTTSANVATTTFSNVPCTSQAVTSETSDGVNGVKQGETSLIGAHFKRSQDGTRQRSKVKKSKEDTMDVSSRQMARNEGTNNDIENAAASNVTGFVSTGRLGKKKKLVGDDGDLKENASDTTLNLSDQSSSSALTEVANKRRKMNTRDKSTCVSSRSIQTNDSDVDVKEGMSYCLDFTVIGKVSNHLVFVSHWNGRDLYGILGDGKPPLEHTYMSRRQLPNNSGTENSSETGSNGSHDRSGTTPSKQRASSKRSNRSSSVCPVNGFPEKSGGKKSLTGGAGRPASASTSELPSAASDSIQDEETSQSPVSWLSVGGSDPLYGVGAGSIGSSSGLTQLKEACTSGMLACPVAGCGYRFDTQAQMTLHRRSHFDRSGQHAIYLESVATQTCEADFIPFANKDGKASTKEKEVKAEVLDFPADAPDLMPASQVPPSKPLLSQINIGSSDEKIVVAGPPGDNASTNLTSTEQQSIKKMFEVVGARPLELAGAVISPVVKKALRTGADVKATSKGFDALMPVDQSCPSSSALDAIQKMVSDGAQSTSVPSSATTNLCVNRQDGVSRQGQLPTTNSSSTKGLSVSGEKSNDVHATLTEVPSVGLLCTNVSSITTSSVTTATLSNSSVEISTNAPMSSATVEISKKAETKQPPTISSVVNSFSPISPFPALDGNAFSQALRPLGMPVGTPSLQVASTSAGLLPQPLYMMPFPMPTISSSPVVPTGKHKIHDLKTTSAGISSAPKDNSPLVRMSPSMIASPGARPPSVGPSGGQSVNIKSNQQQHNVNASTSNQRPSSGAPFIMTQPMSAAQPASERNAANLNYLQQQQQAMFFQQYMNQMRFPAAFPGMMTPPTSVSMAHQAAYEQLAAMQQLGIYTHQFQPK